MLCPDTGHLKETGVPISALYPHLDNKMPIFRTPEPPRTCSRCLKEESSEHLGDSLVCDSCQIASQQCKEHTLPPVAEHIVSEPYPRPPRPTPTPLNIPLHLVQARPPTPPSFQSLAPNPMVDITRIRLQSHIHHCLRPGAQFKGFQKSGRNSYDVNVTIVVSPTRPVNNSNSVGCQLCRVISRWLSLHSRAHR